MEDRRFVSIVSFRLASGRLATPRQAETHEAEQRQRVLDKQLPFVKLRLESRLWSERKFFNA